MGKSRTYEVAKKNTGVGLCTEINCSCASVAVNTGVANLMNQLQAYYKLTPHPIHTYMHPEICLKHQL